MSNLIDRRSLPRAHFFDLPLELREQIYALALPSSVLKSTDTDDKTWPVFYESARGPLPFHLYEWKPGNLDLLRVNKQMNEEASHVFYRSNVFNVVITDECPQLAMRYVCENASTRTYRPLVPPPIGPSFLTRRAVTRYQDISKVPRHHLQQIRHLFIVISRNAAAVVATASALDESAVADAVRDRWNADRYRLQSMLRKEHKRVNEVLRIGLRTLQRSFEAAEISKVRASNRGEKRLTRRQLRSLDHSLIALEVVLYPSEQMFYDSPSTGPGLLAEVRKRLVGILAGNGRYSIRQLDCQHESPRGFLVDKYVVGGANGTIEECDYDWKTKEMKKAGRGRKTSSAIPSQA